MIAPTKLTIEPMPNQQTVKPSGYLTLQCEQVSYDGLNWVYEPTLYTYHPQQPSIRITLDVPTLRVLAAWCESTAAIMERTDR